MGRLYDLTVRLNKVIEEKNLDKFAVRGNVSLRTGFVLGLVRQDTPDDEEKIKLLTAAIKEVLGITL